ncbi:hypothetical protein F383_22889 [Gossypium arboreum]|uniref:Uncharacterized protein n=1 Tax=Gossypium arboreum TaxID=29729 RepID=A0A0B0P0W0_GOSAR|nr:hypothetical protein F383_22889 [Gossypium arboreum]
MVLLVIKYRCHCPRQGLTRHHIRCQCPIHGLTRNLSLMPMSQTWSYTKSNLGILMS